MLSRDNLVQILPQKWYVFQLLGDLVPRPLIGALPMNPTEGLPSTKPPTLDP